MCIIENNLEKSEDFEEINKLENEINSTEEKRIPRKCPGSSLPKWREGELSVKEYHLLPTERKQEHIQYISTLEPSILGDSDEYLLRMYHKKEVKNFFSINDNPKLN